MSRRSLTPTFAIAFAGSLLVAATAADAQQRQPRPDPAGSPRSGAPVEVRTPQTSEAPARVAVEKQAPPEGAERLREARARRSPRSDRDDDRTDRRNHHRGYHYPVYRGPYSYHPWFWWGPYAFYPYSAWGYGPYAYLERPHEGMGALDLDLRPEKAEVYLDGFKIGVADNFDGWPRYLWLDEGTYDLVFYHEGFETLARQYSIYPGVVIDVEDEMVPGEARLPEDLVARSTERRDERLRRRAERGEVPAPAAWRDRVESERAEMAELDARGEPARLRLEVSPSDAAIYLDGRFLGTGDDLRGVRAGLIVDPGDHELEVSRPGYRTATRTFTAEAGEEVELELELEEE